MPIDIQNVLVCDAVDPSCVELLKSNGISVDYKLKLPKEALVEEAKVKRYKRRSLKIETYNVQKQEELSREFMSIQLLEIKFYSFLRKVFSTPTIREWKKCDDKLSSVSRFQNYDAIIVRSDTKITGDVLASGAGGKLKVVGRAGVGVDNIDIDAATKNNIVVLK